MRSGVYLIKFWFSVSRKEQRRRFKERETHPLKQWKLSPIDLASLDKWDDYTKAKEAMFFETDTADAPWTVIKSDCKKRARLNAMRYVLHKLPYTSKVHATTSARSTPCWSDAPTWSTSAVNTRAARCCSSTGAGSDSPFPPSGTRPASANSTAADRADRGAAATGSFGGDDPSSKERAPRTDARLSSLGYAPVEKETAMKRRHVLAALFAAAAASGVAAQPSPASGCATPCSPRSATR